MGRKKKLDQLTIDSTNAIKAGMSYGYYMALKKHTTAQSERKSNPDFDGYKHTCEQCGKEFVIFHKKKRKYCSDQCRKQHYLDTKKIQIRKKICPICGKEFMPETYRNKYCSEFCSRAGQVDRVREYRERKMEEVMT